MQNLFKDLKNFKIHDNFSEINQENNIILFATIGKITNKETLDISNRLTIQEKKIFGLILIEEST